MATNGLRYGAGIELRENFTGQSAATPATTQAATVHRQTVYVRRAFTYVAGEHWGIVRVGMAVAHRHLRQRRDDRPVPDQQFQRRRQSERAGRRRAVLLPVHARRRVWQLEARLSLAADRRLRFRLPMGAELFERLRHQHRQPANASITSAGIGTGLGCATSATSGCPTLSSGPGILDGSTCPEPDRDWRPLPGHVRRPGRVGLCRL